MSEPLHSDRVRFSSPPALLGVELVHAQYRERAFPTHAHREFVVGVITSGAETLEIGKDRLVAAAGTTLLLNAEQAHANASIAPDPLAYRVFYLPPATVSGLPSLPEFPWPIERSPVLFSRVLQAHQALDRPGSRLEQELAIAGLMEALSRFANRSVVVRKAASCGAGVRRIKAYIDARYAYDFGLDELCAVAGLSRFHLVRSFKRATGMSPLAYRTQRRIDAARTMLRGSRSVTEIASLLGFADHAHLTRQFQRLVGTTPSNYRAQ